MFQSFFHPKSAEKKQVTKDELTSFLVHEFRTPLSMAMLYLGLLREKSSSREEEKYLEEMAKGFSRIAKLTDTLSALAKTKIETMGGVFESLHLEEAIEKTVKREHAEIAEKHVDADIRRIFFHKKALLELIAHAIKTLGGQNRSRRFSLVLRNEGGGIIMKIIRLPGKGGKKIHNGPDDLFPAGTALETYYAKLLLERHGGKCWSEESREGRETAFCIYLPIIN